MSLVSATTQARLKSERRADFRHETTERCPIYERAVVL